MTIMKINGVPKSNLRRRKLGALLSSSDDSSSNQDNSYRYNDDYSSTTHYHHHHSPRRNSDASAPVPPAQSNYYNMTPPAMFYSNPNSTASSPYLMSPWSQHSPYIKSPWIQDYDDEQEQQYYKTYNRAKKYGLIGSLLREEGHIYSLAATGNLLYTGSDSKNIRVWNKNLQDVSGFKSSSGLVKVIVVSHDKIFTGHPDGKIRVWKFSDGKYKRVGSLPTTRDLLMKSINPKNYVEVRRNHNVPWIKHYDAVSCMSIDTNQGLLYSGSWDRTFKVWRISDSRCIESIRAHEDAVNSVVVASVGLVFTGSADGTVKAWRRELVGKLTQHVLVEVLLKQDHALTSLAVSNEALYAGSSDGLVSFWERKKKYMTHGGVLRGHKVAVLCLAVGGVSLVMSGSADKSICVWRREGGGVHTCLAVLRGHGGPVKCIAVEKEEEEEEGGDGGWIIYSGSLDKSVKVWRVSGQLRQLQEE